MTTPNTYQGEAMLLRWGDNNSSGRTVTFQIEEEGPHPFKGYPSGAKNGQRFMIVAVPIAADETVDRDAIAKAKVKRAWHEIPRSQQAAILIGDAKFQNWYWNREIDQDRADRYFKHEMLIKSKKELDSDSMAAAKFDDLVRRYRAATGQEPEQRG